MKLLGKSPSQQRKSLMDELPYYSDGSFKNIDFTPNFSEEFKMGKVLRNMLFPKVSNLIPAHPVPNIRTDLNQLPNDALVWFGHSSYLLKLANRYILVDPVFSGSASPLLGSVKAFDGSNIYSVEDMPQIDLLLITHDHYDHLDYKTIKALKNKVNKVVCGIGVGEHLEYWGYDASSITELVWHQSASFFDELNLTATPVRHFSGRTFKRNNTLFCSYVLQYQGKKIFIGGDSGYGSHFKDIGANYGPFDFGILECGQYNTMWKEIHALPDDWNNIVDELKLKQVMPVHFGKFKLAMHPWNEPVDLFYQQMTDKKLPVFTPKIGECVSYLELPNTQRWW